MAKTAEQSKPGAELLSIEYQKIEDRWCLSIKINIFTTTAHFLWLQILLVFVYLTTYLTFQFNQHI